MLQSFQQGGPGGSVSMRSRYVDVFNTTRGRAVECQCCASTDARRHQQSATRCFAAGPRIHPPNLNVPTTCAHWSLPPPSRAPGRAYMRPARGPAPRGTAHAQALKHANVSMHRHMPVLRLAGISTCARRVSTILTCTLAPVRALRWQFCLTCFCASLTTTRTRTMEAAAAAPRCTRLGRSLLRVVLQSTL
jgi:hypothetical protein